MCKYIQHHKALWNRAVLAIFNGKYLKLPGDARDARGPRGMIWTNMAHLAHPFWPTLFTAFSM